MVQAGDGRLIIGLSGAGLAQIAGDKIETYPIHSEIHPNELVRDRDVDSNKLLRDRDGGLWIATVERGLIHVHDGRTDVFTKADGLSGDVVLRLFEDHEGNVWVSTTGGLDRFRELPVTTISRKQGLSSDATNSVLAAADGSIWVGTHDGLTRFKAGQTSILRKGRELPNDATQSLFEDDRGRIWGTFTGHGLSYFKDGRFVAVKATVPSAEVYSITGDKAGNLWLSGNGGLSHLVEGRLVEHFPWAVLGRHQQAKAVLFDPEQGGVWLSFWIDGGVLYFKDGRVRASYSTADGLGKGHVPALRLDRNGALWAATEEGGVSRIKDGRVTTLTTRNGLPCDTIHWTMEDDDRFFWLYTVCGLVRIARSELDAWIADPNRRIQTTLWDPADGIRLRSNAASAFGPTLAKANDGKLWFLTGEGVQVVDPRHIAYNKIPPPVHIEQIVANSKVQWQNSPGASPSNLRLPARVRDLTIDYTALSLVAPEKIHFKYKLEGQDSDWREVINDREVQYSNLRPRSYRFRVIASNNSGVWNEQGDSLEFSIDPAYYQTNWFRALCATAFVILLWGAYQYRVRRLHHDFDMTLEARVGERTRIARDLHDTLLQSFHGLLLRFQTVALLLPERPIEAKEKLESAIEQAAGAITEGRDAVQGLRASTVERNDLALAITTLGEELENDSSNHRPAAFRVAVEGQPRDLHPILRDEIYKIAAEALRNAFHHAEARQVEVEIRYANDQFRLRVRDDGKGMDAAVLSSHGLEGHYGLRGMRERATLIQGKLAVWSEVDEGTEVELRVPASAAYTTDLKRSWLMQKFAGKTKA
jgi:signal transduction histidine kinase/ligand-binding sensor domain-containing protein